MKLSSARALKTEMLEAMTSEAKPVTTMFSVQAHGSALLKSTIGTPE